MTETAAKEKSDLRQHHHTIRRSLLKDEWHLLSRKIIGKLMASEQFQRAPMIHTYVSMEKNREVYTLDLIRDCIKTGKSVAVPRMSVNGELTHHLVESLESLSENKWGVFEPDSGKEIELSDEALIVVPMVAADFQKNRIGYGKGYYDRFLGSVNAFKAGLCYNFNISWNSLPTEPFDIRMDTIFANTCIL